MNSSSDFVLPSELPTAPDFTGKELAFCSTDEARAVVGIEAATKLMVLPIAIVSGPSGPLLHAAAANPSPQLVADLKFLTDSNVRLTKVPESVVTDAIRRAYLGSDEILRREFERVAAEVSADTSIGVSEPSVSGDAARFLQSVLAFGAARGASDIHFCPLNDGAILKLRVDGELLVQERHPYSKTIHEQVISRIKVLARLDISRRALPQDGSFTFRYAESARPVRVSIMPTIHGESAMLRLLYARAIPTIATLGLPESVAGILKRATRRSGGVILLTGPTGSGKTTTLYACLSEVLAGGANVLTVEDPVEIPIPGVTQVQVNPAIGFDFPCALRSALRHDPDALLVGEVRDRESAAIAFETALTGHLTLTSTHSSSAAEVFERLESLGIERSRSAEAVLAIVNQRLAPKLCSRCKVIDLAESSSFKRTLYRPVGCRHCDYSGFDGRIVLCEVISLEDPSARTALRGATFRGEIQEVLPTNAYVSWTVSLESNLVAGHLSPAQFRDFVDRHMGAFE